MLDPQSMCTVCGSRAKWHDSCEYCHQLDISVNFCSLACASRHARIHEDAGYSKSHNDSIGARVFDVDVETTGTFSGPFRSPASPPPSQRASPILQLPRAGSNDIMEVKVEFSPVSSAAHRSPSEAFPFTDLGSPGQLVPRSPRRKRQRYIFFDKPFNWRQEGTQ